MLKMIKFRFTSYVYVSTSTWWLANAWNLCKKKDNKNGLVDLEIVIYVSWSRRWREKEKSFPIGDLQQGNS